MYSYDLKIRVYNYYTTHKISLRNLANIFCVSKSIISFWVHNGIIPKKKQKYNRAIKNNISNFITANIINNKFTSLFDLKYLIQINFNIIIASSSLWYHIKKLGYSYKKITQKKLCSNTKLIDIFKNNLILHTYNDIISEIFLYFYFINFEFKNSKLIK